jgi:hypothetical protein
LVSGKLCPGHRSQRQISLVYDEAEVLKEGDGGAESLRLVCRVEGAALDTSQPHLTFIAIQKPRLSGGTPRPQDEDEQKTQ